MNSFTADNTRIAEAVQKKKSKKYDVAEEIF